MILDGKPAGRLSRLGALVVLAAAVLLPLLPGRAGPPPEEPAPAVPAEHPALLTNQTCMKCHDVPSQVLHWKAGHHNGLDWAHGEAVNLMAQLLAEKQKLQQPAEAGADRAERLLAAQDEVELLRAQVAVARAQYEAAAVTAQAAARKLARIRELHGRGVISEGAYSEAEQEATSSQAQVRVREAQLQVETVRLRQAERRLGALQKAAPPADDSRKQQEKRVRDLERKIQDLVQELKALQRDLGK
jgi:hypothetical protein